MKIFISISSLILITLHGGLSYGNDCATALPLVVEDNLITGSTSGSFSGETYSGASQCEGTGGNLDVWYEFEAITTSMFISAIGQGDLDLAIEVYDACGGALVACQNTSGAGAEELVSLTGLTVGQSYFYSLYHVGAVPAVSDQFSTSAANIPLVELKPSFCGGTDYVTSDIIRSTQPLNTSGILYYQWRFEELEAPFNTYEVVSPNGNNPNFRLWWFDDIRYGRNYNVSVRVARLPGPLIGDYSGVCTISMRENVETTALLPQFSPGFLSFCDVIACESVGGADRYRWEFNSLSVPGNNVSVFGDNNQRLLRLSKVPGLSLGSIYFVSVFAQVNGDESPAGTARLLVTNNFVPNTGLRQDLFPCGSTVPINTAVQAVEICKAQEYLWRFRNTSQAQPDILYARDDGSRFLRLDFVPGLIEGDSYNVDVRGRQGNLTGDFSTICNITIGNPIGGFGQDPEFEGINSEVGFGGDVSFKVEANGNSSASGLIHISISKSNSGDPVRFELYDINGRLIDSQQMFIPSGNSQFTWSLTGLSPGIYVLRSASEGQVTSTKVPFF